VGPCNLIPNKYFLCLWVRIQICFYLIFSRVRKTDLLMLPRFQNEPGVGFSFLLPFVGPEMLSQLYFHLCSGWKIVTMGQSLYSKVSAFSLLLEMLDYWESFMWKNGTETANAELHKWCKLISFCLLIFLLWFRFFFCKTSFCCRITGRNPFCFQFCTHIGGETYS